MHDTILRQLRSEGRGTVRVEVQGVQSLAGRSYCQDGIRGRWSSPLAVNPISLIERVSKSTESGSDSSSAPFECVVPFKPSFLAFTLGSCWSNTGSANIATALGFSWRFAIL